MWQSFFSSPTWAHGGFSSVIRLFVLFVFVSVFSALFAGQAKAADSYWLTSSLNGLSARGTNPDNACINMYAKQTGGVYTLEYTTMVSATSYRCFGRKDGGTVQQYGSANQYTCPTATPYLDPVTLACVGTPPPPPSCTAGVKGGGTWYHSTGPEDQNLANPDSPAVVGGCVASCKVQMYDIEKCYRATDGKNYCTYKYSTTGASCTVGTGAGSTGPQSPAPPMASRQDIPPFSPSTGKCPTGSVQGGVTADGVPICIGTGSDPKNAPPPQPKVESEKSEPTPDGGTKTTHTSTTTNADGSTTTTTTTTTTAPDGSKTTTVDKNTTTNLSGGAGKDDSQREDEKYDLCKQNPMLNICRNSSVSGTCGEVTCQGDAIQCATLRAAAAMECKQRTDEDAIKASSHYGLGSAAAGGNDPQAASLPGPSKATLVEVGALNADGWLGAGAAFEDVTFMVQGNEVVIPFSKATGLLVALRYALMIAAALVSFRILSGAILGS